MRQLFRFLTLFAVALLTTCTGQNAVEQECFLPDVSEMIPRIAETYDGDPTPAIELVSARIVCISNKNETSTVAVTYGCNESSLCEGAVISALVDMRCSDSKWVAQEKEIVDDISAIAAIRNCSLCTSNSIRFQHYSDSPPGSTVYNEENHCLGIFSVCLVLCKPILVLYTCIIYQYYIPIIG